MATMFSHFEGKGIDIMKSSRFFNGTLTALFAVGLFIGGVIPGWATTLTPFFADCLRETPLWDIRHGEMPFAKETALLCQYDSDLLPDDFMGMLKKAASGVLALLPCSRTESTLRASKRLRPCWMNFFEHSPSLMSVAVLKHLWPMNMKYSTGPL